MYGAILSTMQSLIQNYPALFRWRSIVGGLAWVFFVLLWLWLLSGDAESYAWLQPASESPYAVLALILLGIVAMVLLLPGIMITIAAGYLFGLLKGVLLVLVATTIGATIAFWLGRRVLNQSLLNYLDGRHPLLASLNNGLREQSGMVVFLTRLIPFFPFKLSNYYFGAADYRMPSFILGTLLGIIPISVLNVYVGVALARIGRYPSAMEETIQSLWIMLSGGVALVCLITIISRLAARSLSELKEQANQSSNNPSSNSQQQGYV